MRAAVPKQSSASSVPGILVRLALGALLLAPARAHPQNAPQGGPTFTGSVRLRPESWDWFTPAADFDGRYSFFGAVVRGGIGAKRPRYDWQIDLATPVLLGLPLKAIAPAPQGQLGFGGSYRAENGDRTVGLQLKQAYVRVRPGAGPSSPAVRLGRFEYNDGQEMQPANPTLARLKRDRIAARLIGTFGFTQAGRSFDGLHVQRTSPAGDLSLLAARPTEGVFQVDGLKQIDAELVYGAVTRPLWARGTAAKRVAAAEGRLFALYYHDGRDVTKTDNRPLAARRGDMRDIRITSVGAHYLHDLAAGPGRADLLLWGVAQGGVWGVERHRGAAAAAEVGYRPERIPLKPWVRVGYFLGSGDADPNDGAHETFFQVLPTPRGYARVPFYNLMNVEDGFAQLILSPTPRWTVRSEAHRLRLAEPNDLWYAGGGAFDAQSFGYAGRPSGGARDLARLFDLSVDYQPRPTLGVTVYAGWARGRDVISSLHPRGANAMFTYVEVNRQF